MRIRSPYKLFGLGLMIVERQSADRDILGTSKSPLKASICLEDEEGDKMGDISMTANDS